MVESVRQFSGSKKKSTRVDLTPLVDLGFLLITFFIFTTSLAQPVTMKLNLPDDTPVDLPNNVSADKSITLILDNRKVFYYSGFFTRKLEAVDYSRLRSVIAQKKLQVLKRFQKNSLTILIKPTIESNYQNVVDVLDEIIINDITTYILDELNKGELEQLKSVK